MYSHWIIFIYPQRKTFLSGVFLLKCLSKGVPMYILLTNALTLTLGFVFANVKSAMHCSVEVTKKMRAIYRACLCV